MKTSLTSLFIVVCIGFLTIQASSQVVLPPAGVVQHYKDQNKRIQSHSIKQITAFGNGDSLYQSYLSVVDTGLNYNFLQRTMASTGFPLGNALTKLANGRWQSRTADSTLLEWDFSIQAQNSWTVFQDGTNQLTGTYMGTDTFTHFSTSVAIWKYKLTNAGLKFSWLNNREIWLSTYGVLRTPDLHVFPYQKAELILTGYDSPADKKGIYFTSVTYTPYATGDTIVLGVYDNADYPRVSKSYFDVHQLDSLLITSPIEQNWLVKTRRYQLENGLITSDTSWTGNQLKIETLAFDSGRLVAAGNNRVVLLYDSLPFEQNPNSAYERTYAIRYNADSTKAYFIGQGPSSVTDDFWRTEFKGDWGFKYLLHRGVYRQGVGYLKKVINCTYQTVGNRRYGSPPPLPLGPASTDFASKPGLLPAYPNPTTNQLSIDDKLMVGQLVQVQVINGEGHIVQQLESHFPLQFDLAGYAAGMYSVRITGPAGYAKYARFIKINP